MREELPDRYFYSRGKVVPLGQLLADVLAKRNSVDKNYQKVKNVWQQVVSSEAYRNTEIVGMRNGILYVSVESTAMFHHLANFERDAIVTKINKTVGVGCIRDIRFRAGSEGNVKGR